MKRKIQKSYIYHGLGFPVVLTKVPMVQVRGIWTPDIRYNLLQETVLIALALSRTPLHGAYVAFVRGWLRLNLEEFGKLFGVSHAAVIKWEKTKDRPAKISVGTEQAIRLYVLDAVLTRATEFRDAYRQLVEKGFSGKRQLRIKVDVQKDLAAA